MGRKIRNLFNDSLYNIENSYTYYLNKLIELACSNFKWNNLPTTISERYLENTLFYMGKAVYFNDPNIGNLALKVKYDSRLNVYDDPIRFTAYGNNGYNYPLTIENGVIMYNNYTRTTGLQEVQYYAQKLAHIDIIINVNVNAQKTPVLLLCSENEKLTVEQLYQKYDGSQPYIFGNKGLSVQELKVLKTDAPFNADKLYALKQLYWKEALTSIGVYAQETKKERLTEEEVYVNANETAATRNSRLRARQEACQKINDMFGLNISVECGGYNESEVLKNE